MSSKKPTDLISFDSYISNHLTTNPKANDAHDWNVFFLFANSVFFHRPATCTWLLCGWNCAPIRIQGAWIVLPLNKCHQFNAIIFTWYKCWTWYLWNHLHSMVWTHIIPETDIQQLDNSDVKIEKPKGAWAIWMKD